MFTVNGKELEYDIFELENAERFEQEMNAVVEKMDALQKSADGTSLSQGIRLQCEVIAECFDHLFGKGTAAKVFDGRVNLMLAITAYKELVNGITAEKSRIERMASAEAAKFNGNRAQRRIQK